MCQMAAAQRPSMQRLHLRRQSSRQALRHLLCPQPRAALLRRHPSRSPRWSPARPSPANTATSGCRCQCVHFTAAAWHVGSCVHCTGVNTHAFMLCDCLTKMLRALLPAEVCGSGCLCQEDDEGPRVCYHRQAAAGRGHSGRAGAGSRAFTICLANAWLASKWSLVHWLRNPAVTRNRAAEQCHNASLLVMCCRASRSMRCVSSFTTRWTVNRAAGRF